MKLLKWISKNAFRHKLRSILTILGIALAALAFGVLRTVIIAWHSGVDAAAPDRLIVRHAVSIIFPLPYAYRDRIANVPGVDDVTYANWFGGVYIDESHFFPRLAVDAESYFRVYSDYLLSPEEMSDFQQQRNACVIGSTIARRYNLKLGDVIVLQGDIYYGQWEFVVRGIYRPKYETTDATQMLFHWSYINERLQQDEVMDANKVGWYVVKIDQPEDSPLLVSRIDALFANSAAETKTETESAFQQGFVSASNAIIQAIHLMSFVIIGIIMLVLANTMIMSARERTREYAVLKTLGFSARHLVLFIAGESVLISILGGLLGLGLTFPVVRAFSQVMPQGMFPVFKLEPVTIALMAAAVLLVGLAVAIFPARRALHTSIVDGLRFAG